MSKNNSIPYDPKLKEYARALRKNSTLAEVLLWNNIKNGVLGAQFHTQVPLLNFIVDFYCHELMLAIEIDGRSHDFKYGYNEKKQGLLEQKGVRFLGFSDMEIKTDMANVMLTIADEVKKQVANTPLTFPKKERLKSKKLLEQLFLKGSAISAFPLKLLYLKTPLPKDVPFQVTLVAPKRNFKSAVKRNRIKRLLKEAYRLNKPAFFNNTKGQYALVILYLGKEMPSFSQIESGTKTLLTKLLKKISNE
ncbi:ribonuclease P protein component [Allomuricauda sp. SCSIO 64092]|uniref:ribonuclease P protein component n=1 Tax=Allomuricauda sp. SCSIO 64092 TaxID=2908842 RepID=UPI00248CF135|nr:ribonuclease P protein component [Muricauda sp. SCSIO 64092]